MLFKSFFIPLSKQFVFFSFSVMITWRAVSVKPVCFVLWRFTVQLVRRPWCHTWPSCLGQRFEFILVSWLLPLMDQDEMKWTFLRAWYKVKIWVVDRIRTHDLPGTGIRELMGSKSVGDSDLLFTHRSAFHLYHLFTKLKIYHLSLFCGYRFDSRLFKGLSSNSKMIGE